MKKCIFFIFFLLSFVLYAQTAPSSYTTHYHYRKWSAGANPSADSLNAQWDDLDANLWGVADSTRSLYTLFFISHTSLGDIKSGVIDWDMLSSAAKSEIVQTATISQNIAGTKSFTGTLQFSGKDGILLLPDESVGLNLTPTGLLSHYGSYVFFYTSSTTRDTLASWAKTRSEIHDSLSAFSTSNFVTLTGSQTVSGDKTYTGQIANKKNRYTPVTYTYDEDANAGILTIDNTFVVLTSITGTSPTIKELDGYSTAGNYIIMLNASSASVTLENGTNNLRLSGAADYSLGVDGTIELIYYGSYWYQVGGSHN